MNGCANECHTACVSVEKEEPQETGPRGAAQYVAHFQQLRKVAALKAAPATSLHPQTPFCACAGFLPVLPLLLLLLLLLPFLLPSPRQNPNSIWMPANAKFVCRPNSWPFLLFWKLVVVLLAFSSSSSSSPSALLLHLVSRLGFVGQGNWR